PYFAATPGTSFPALRDAANQAILFTDVSLVGRASGDRPAPGILEDDYEARRPFDRRSSLAARAQPAGRCGDRLRHAGPGRAGVVACELGPGLGAVGLGWAAGLRQAARTCR